MSAFSISGPSAEAFPSRSFPNIAITPAGTGDVGRARSKAEGDTLRTGFKNLVDGDAGFQDKMNRHIENIRSGTAREENVAAGAELLLSRANTILSFRNTNHDDLTKTQNDKLDELLKNVAAKKDDFEASMKDAGLSAWLLQQGSDFYNFVLNDMNLRPFRQD